METREYRTLDRSRWSPGPWDSEPDKIQWQDEATGLPCMVRRSPHMGFWCGYVGVPEGHPAFGQGYDDVTVEVHGGLTFAEKCSKGDEATSICHVPGVGESDNVWWLGFDCGHAGDLYPSRHPDFIADSYMKLGEMFDAMSGSGDESEGYRDLAYVRAEVTKLAAQLAAQGNS